MCNIRFDEQAVQHAILERAARCHSPVYHVDPIQVYRDLYAGQPVGGIKLHFIEKVKRAMADIEFREAFLERAESERLELHQVSVTRVVDDILGVHLSPDDRVTAFQMAQAVWYDMIIEESQALRAE